MSPTSPLSPPFTTANQRRVTLIALTVGWMVILAYLAMLVSNLIGALRDGASDNLLGRVFSFAGLGTDQPWIEAYGTVVTLVLAALLFPPSWAYLFPALVRAVRRRFVWVGWDHNTGPGYPRTGAFQQIRHVFELLWLIVVIQGLIAGAWAVAGLLGNGESLSLDTVFQAISQSAFLKLPIEVKLLLGGAVAVVFLLALAAFLDTRYENRHAKRHPKPSSDQSEYILVPVSSLDPLRYVPAYLPDIYLERHDLATQGDADEAARAALRQAAQRDFTTVPASHDQIGICVFGRPMQGKTRLAWEAMRAILPEWTFVTWPQTPAAPLDLSARQGDRIILWLDNLHEYAKPDEALRLKGLAATFAAKRIPLVIVATCRDGEEENRARGQLADFLLQLTEVRPADLAPQESHQLATELENRGIAVESADGTPGALILGVERMAERYRTLPAEAQALLQPTQVHTPRTLTRYPAGEDVMGYYHAWLDNESKRWSTQYFTAAWRGFYLDVHQQRSHRATAAAASFATIDRTRSAITTVTRSQVFVFLLLTMGIITALYVAGPTTLTLLLGGVTFAYLIHLALMAIMAAAVIGKTPDERFSQEFIEQLDSIHWPHYTVLCPLYKETGVITQFVAAMQALDYPQDKLQVLFLTEADDDATREAIERLHLPAHFEVVTVPDGSPRTKPRACNYGLLLARGGFVVIYDAEDVPDPLQLKKAVLAFANHGASLACVQAKLGFYNARQNLLTRWFALEYALWFNITLPGLQWARLSLPLGGTSNHFRTDVLRHLGGWDVFNVTEDCDLGLRLAERHLYTSMLDSTTLEEANSNVGNWIRQRSRWIKGYMQTYLVHLRRPWNYILQGRIRELFSLFAIIGSTPATFLVNPLMWGLLGLYIAQRRELATEFQLLYSAPIFYPAVICLVVGNFLYLYLYLISSAKSEQYHLLLWTLTIPFYWMLMSIAAVVALYQLVVKPHHWEKTQHGLHLSHEEGTPKQAHAPASTTSGV